MKFRPVIPCTLLAISMTCLAQEPNPFVKKDQPKPPEPAAGASYVGILEHILVPPDLINDWMRENGMPADANGLRAVVQQWVEKGKATLDHTSVGLGVGNRRTVNESILEQIYATEYEPNGPGVWPSPTSFETRNLGYTEDFNSDPKDGANRLSLGGEFVEMQGNTVWDFLMEKTRQPDDVFFPIVRSMRLAQGTWDGQSADPFAEKASPAGGSSGSTQTSAFSMEGGKYTLVSRMDPLEVERKSGLPSRLVFLRSDFAKGDEKVPTSREINHVSFSAVRVPHLEFSAWLQKQAPLSVSRDAWLLAESLRKDGKAELLDAADGVARSGSRWTLENIREVIYPTEWEPANRKVLLEHWEQSQEQKVDGKPKQGTATYGRYNIEAIPGLKGASMATAFETRNTGSTLEMDTTVDDKGILANLSLSRVNYVADTVYRRIEDQGNWIPDVKLPLFASNRCSTTCRLVPGQWTLISSGSEYSGPGKVDREHCLLMFVKVE